MTKLAKLSINRDLLGSSVPFRGYIWAALATNLAVILLVLSIRKFLPPQVPLLYGTAEGEGQLAPSLALAIPNLTALLITMVNLAISASTKDDFLKKTLVLTALAATFFASITTIKIVFLVGSF